MIELKNLAIGYRQCLAENLNLHIEEGKITALLGANGCGKTTLLKTLLGLLKPHRGEILIQKRPHFYWTRHKLARTLAYVPQAHNSVFAFKTEDIVLMGRTAYFSWYRTPKARDKQIVAECLDTLGITHLCHQYYTRLSGGERQLVLIARALAQQPRCLIMDEPTSSLDFGNQIRVLEHIRRLCEQGLTVLFTTHQPEHVLRYAGQAVLFHQGHILAQGAPSQIMTLSNLSHIYRLDQRIIAKNLTLPE